MALASEEAAVVVASELRARGLAIVDGHVVDARALNFPGRARAGEGSPSQSLAEKVREKYHQVVSKNREDTLQKSLEQFTDERLTRYEDLLTVDVRMYVPMYMLWCSRAFGYTFGRPIGYVRPKDETDTVTEFTREFDRARIPLKGRREELWFESLAGEPPSQDEMDILQRLTRDRSGKK